MKKLILILLAGITIQANAETNKEIKFRAYNKDKIIYIIPKDTPKWCIEQGKEATKKAISKIKNPRNRTFVGKFRCKDYY